MPKTVSKTRSTTGTTKSQPAQGDVAPKSSVATPKLAEGASCWIFCVTGKGTSGWMSWVQEEGRWVPLRASETSFISAVAAIEPELMRVAFPHRTTQKKAI
jgi:hypothetical protein